MTTPNNQPTPPPGMPMNMRLATEEDRKGIVPVGAMHAYRSRHDGYESRWDLSGNVGINFQADDRDYEHFYAIPITPTATGDTTNEKGGEHRQNKAFLEAAITEQIAHAEHWKEHYTADPNGAEDKAYWNGRHTAFQEAMNLIQSAPVEQRQELLPWTRINDSDPNSIPQKPGYYIVACQGGNVDTSFFSPDVDFFRGKAPSRKLVGKHSRCFELSKMGYRIVAWMPKPQPPEYALQ